MGIVSTKPIPPKLRAAPSLVEPFDVGGALYLAGSKTQLPIDLKGAPRLLTVIRVDDGVSDVTSKWLEDFLAKANDDVFSQEFLQGVVLVSAKPKLSLSKDAERLLADQGMRWKRILQGDYENLTLGPHVVVGDFIAPVYKLYDDTHRAFLHSLWTTENRTFEEVKIAGCSIETLKIAVPSRLASPKSDRLPLAGWRVAVKDIFEIAQVRTTVCNKAYYELYDAPAKTAACVERLIGAGAAVVGTTKLASFAATEEPVECIDYQAPWNPRADGYQSPAGSSSGSGAACGAYEWLDITIGSDTSGSGRRPGHWNGCFAMRPTHGVLPVEGYIPSFRRFDVPTFFGRDLQDCRYFAQSWYGSDLRAPKPTGAPAIIYPTDYISLIRNKTQVALIDSFVADLEKYLGVEHKKVSCVELWDKDPPAEADGASCHEYMKDASRNSFFYDDYHSFDKFREDYEKKFDRQPYVSPPVRWQWELSSKITQEERNEACKRLDVYKKWFLEQVAKEHETDAIVIIPIEEISPRYRDDPPLKPFNPVGVPNLFLSPILGGPELTIPIGYSAFESKVTGKTGNLPVAISLLACPGRDLELFDIALGTLKQAGRPLAVKAGPEMF